MKCLTVPLLLLLIAVQAGHAQFNLKNVDRKSGVYVKAEKNELLIRWPAGGQQKGQMRIGMEPSGPLFKSIGLITNGTATEIVKGLDPVFLLTTGKRNLVPENGWDKFFDKVHLKPYQTHRVQLSKKQATVTTRGTRTIISIDEVSAPGFTGTLEITLYSGSPMFNIAAVMSTAKDSTAILYDAGLTARDMPWQQVSWSTTSNQLVHTSPQQSDTAKNEAVKYRTIVGSTAQGSVAVFPPPHQYFYPLDEAFNLRFVWHGHAYRKMVDGYGLGIRQDPNGDRRFVPWFNAPPGTRQRLNFFCLLSAQDASAALTEVKKFTNNDRYVALPEYKTLSSHFHNEYVMNVIMKGKPVPETPEFVAVFRSLGLDIVHLGEFHYTAHPHGPDETRLKELHALFELCRRASSKQFLLLPGEEPNEFFGGHWLQLFPKPVYWIMARAEDIPFVNKHPKYGTVYRVSNAAEMLEILQKEKGLAWTAHPRIKGSTGYPDKYRNETFFQSDRFLGGAWKPMPADLSQPRLGKRVLDLLDDMSNWGAGKKILAEADLFTVTHENEMYAHMNVNYLQLDHLPAFDDGWQPVVDALQKGKYFSTTGEVLIPRFAIGNATSGDTATLASSGNTTVAFDLQWTFPLQFAEIISGDGKEVFRHRVELDNTTAFGSRTFTVSVNLKDKKWVRLEVWDAAANGAFTQTIYLK